MQASAPQIQHVHVIPVPEGMDPLDAFEEIRIFGRLTEGRVVEEDGTGGCWATIECGGNCGMEPGWLVRLLRWLLRGR